MASRASRSASENVPSSIRTWASPATTVARATEGAVGTRSTARRRAASAPSASPATRRNWPESVVDQAERRRSRRPSATRSPPRGRPRRGRSAGGERGLGGTGALRRRRPAARGRAVARDVRRSLPDRDGQLEGASSSSGRIDASPRHRRPRSPRAGPRRSRGRPRSDASRRTAGRSARGPPRGGDGSRIDGSRSASIARPTSSWRRARPSSSSRMKPYSIASSRPAVRSASRTPSPRPWRVRRARRGRSDRLGLERLGDRGQVGAAEGRPAGARSRRRAGLRRADADAGQDEVLE